MIGICRLIQGISVKPAKNSPKPIMIKLSGNIVVGPIKRLDSPHKSSPSQIRLTGSIILFKYDTANAIESIPNIKILHIRPGTNTESVNSAILNESMGSTYQYAICAKKFEIEHSIINRLVISLKMLTFELSEAI